MSRIKIYILSLVICCLLAVGSSFAAVRLLSESGTGASAIAEGGDAGTGGEGAAQDDCSHATYPSAYPSAPIDCTANNGISCVEKTYCQDNVEVTVSECPTDLEFVGTDSDISATYGSKAYCCGYRDGNAYACYFEENPHLCKWEGIFDSYDVNSKTCGNNANISQRGCVVVDGDSQINIDYCKLANTTGLAQCLGTAGTDWFYSLPTDCTDSPYICYHSCGNNVNCAGFSCDTSQLINCDDLLPQYSDYYPVEVSEGTDGAKACKTTNDDDDEVKKFYLFECKKAEFPYTTCDGTNVECDMCSSGGRSFYMRGCPEDYSSLSEFCTTYSNGDSNAKQQCEKDYYCPVSSYCEYTDTDSNTIQRCKSSAITQQVKMCDVYERTGLAMDMYDDSCAENDVYPNTGVAEKSCRVNSEFKLSSKTICLYCQDYWTSDVEAGMTLCEESFGVLGSICNIPVADPEGDGVLMGCNCHNSIPGNEIDYYKDVKEYCNANPTIPDCWGMTYFDTEEQLCHTKPEIEGKTFADDVTYYGKIVCPEKYKTQEQWCEDNIDKIPNYLDCMNDYIGEGRPCTYESGTVKYAKYVRKCTADYKTKKDECRIDSVNEPEATECSYTTADGDTSIGYICSCPKSYVAECPNSFQTLSGISCSYGVDAEGVMVTRYEKCQLACGNKYAQAFGSSLDDCPYIDGYMATLRTVKANNNGVSVYEAQKCINRSTNKELNICGCPTNFKTQSKWCADNWVSEGLSSESDCLSNYKGMGTECSWDIETDSQGNPLANLKKYAYYVRYCPTDRPLYYSESDCQDIGGEFDYSCVDTNGNERAVCKCLSSWYSGANYNSDDVDGDDGEGEQLCKTQSLGGISMLAEASGKYCDFDGEENLRYKDCVAKCSSILENTEIALPNAYTYLDSDSSTPTQSKCSMLMGNGAVLGYGSQAYCSLNHTTMYPCYCPVGMVECLAEHNEQPAEGASICSINGKTYYSKCEVMRCPTPSPTMAVVSASTDVVKEFGNGAIVHQCTQDGDEMLQVTCDTSVYVDPCEYPYAAPKEGSSDDSWCKYGTGSTLMKDGKKFYKKGACRIQKTLGECGKTIAGDEDGNYNIFVANKESDCKSNYGPGIKTQLCEYGEDQGYKRAYNCYYNPEDFKWDTSNCGVRHDLTGNYIIVKGKKKWDQCNCATAYQHHKFNCGGMLSGNPCNQEISQSLIDSDSSLRDAIDEGYKLKGKVLPFYPYCECSADYTEICDEDGSGRYKGVGEPCNGKYTACECVPDELPSGWTDNYYGCAGGKKPTGVWKDNGCGKKYYQCTVVECTWEYTEMCEAPLIPVGEPCQDNEGKIGGYKRCSCPVDYKTCPQGQVGEGEPCNLKGVSYYKSCKSQETCSSIANETCTGQLQIGVNPCTKDDITYYENCVCANGYDKVCGEGEVGVGMACEINGVKHYKECIEPDSNVCTLGHVTACDTNQESYSPCVDVDDKGKQVVKYLCRCPSNWWTSASCSNGTVGGERCTQKNALGDEQTYYSQCVPSNECSDYQNLTYSVCTESQTGDGGSCVQTSSVSDSNGNVETQTLIKHAVCKDSNNCVATGFKYSCSGYDSSALGESCIDANGNKLYKECPCPSNYSTCSNPNASKGSKCVPLLASGNLGDTLYSSCACDRSKYKYTCEAAETGNKGIKAPNTANYCEIEEEKEVSSTDADGNTTTETKVVKTKYYSSCDCADEYKYTCSGAGGETYPDEYSNDYCQINTTRFYKGCECDNEVYSKTQDDCAAEGKLVDEDKGICTMRGIIPVTSYGEDGEVFTSNKNYGSGVKKYQGCICRPNYILKCDGTDKINNQPVGTKEKYDFDNMSTCENSNGDAYYSQCKCSADTEKTCNKTGKNQGIIAEESTVCVELMASSSGVITAENKTTNCICEEGYEYYCQDPKYDQTGQNYCDIGDGDIKYKSCVCDPIVYETTPSAGGTSAETKCGDKQVNENATPQYCDSADGSLRYFNRSICTGDDKLGDDWIELDGGTYKDIADFVTYYGKSELYDTVAELCGHGYNANITLDANNHVYYQCIDATVKSSTKPYYTEEECKENDTNTPSLWQVSGSSITINTNWANKKAVLYPTCGCPSNYTNSKSCDTNFGAALTYSRGENNQGSWLTMTLDAPMCVDHAHESGRYAKNDGYINDKTQQCYLIKDGEACQQPDGTIKYDWSKCRCDPAHYSEMLASSTKYKACGYRGDSSCHYEYCMDASGLRRTAKKSGMGDIKNVDKHSAPGYYVYFSYSSSSKKVTFKVKDDS